MNNSKRLVYISVIVFLLVVFLSGIALFSLYIVIGIKLNYGKEIIPVAAILCFLSIFCMWSFLKTKWLIWIVERSTLHHFIKKVAYKYDIISDSKLVKFFDIKLFVNNPRYLECLDIINKAQFDNDMNIPRTLIIRYSIIKILIIPFILMLSILIMFRPNLIITLIIILAFLIISIICYFKYVANNKILVKIDDNGIEVDNTLISWDKIKIESSRIIRGSKYNPPYFIFDYIDNNEIITKKINIGNVNISPRKIDYFLYIFLNRKEKES